LDFFSADHRNYVKNPPPPRNQDFHFNKGGGGYSPVWGGGGFKLMSENHLLEVRNKEKVQNAIFFELKNINNGYL